MGSCTDVEKVIGQVLCASLDWTGSGQVGEYDGSCCCSIPSSSLMVKAAALRDNEATGDDKTLSEELLLTERGQWEENEEGMASYTSRRADEVERGKSTSHVDS